MSEDPLLSQLRGGGKRAMAEALARIDKQRRSAEVNALLDAAYAAPRAHVIGLTGPPGVGKSTLVNALIGHWRARGETVGVIAVDPSSRVSGGALLGDRVRMRTDPDDQGVFVRSLAARGRLGGVSDITFAATVLMRAVYNRVVVETVGVGQSEADIVAVADTVVLCAQPGSGDAMQFMKAGIMEIPHIAVVTKSDSGPAASRALAEMKGALSLAAPTDPTWDIPCRAISAATGQGVEALIDLMDAHRAKLERTGALVSNRERHAEQWLMAAVREAYGAEGVAALGPDATVLAGAGPFSREAELTRRLVVTLRD
ncbi:MAG: methylmalonyl Co-A mutase-associated GTPase MeaB [Hyphomicrobiales bacterium]|nr:methylmalonyl Co-A mutase-associated GTPase MeaB [Hyphomicrobiales bacterium]